MCSSLYSFGKENVRIPTSLQAHLQKKVTPPQSKLCFDGDDNDDAGGVMSVKTYKEKGIVRKM